MQPFRPPHGQPHGPPPGPPQWPQAVPMAPISPPPTVKGIPLAPGERVVFYKHDDGKTTRIVFVIVGVLLLVAVLGVIFLIAALFDYRETIVITTQRFILVKGKDPPKWIPHGQVRRLVRVMKGGLRNIDLYDANDNELSFLVRSTPALAEAITRYVENPALTAQAPSVPYEA